MKQTTNNNAHLFIPSSERRGAYTAPRIEIIFLDNEISLALESSPPAGPDESASLAPEYMKYDPFKSNIV